MARIRKLSAADIPEAAEVLRAAGLWGSEDDAPERHRRFLEAFLGRDNLYIGEENSVLSGIVWFCAEPVFASGGFVLLLVVRPDMRRRGIGRQLIGFVERKVFSQAQSVHFCISSANAQGFQFLEKMGYMKVSEVPPSPAGAHSEWILRKTADPGGSPRRAQRPV